MSKFAHALFQVLATIAQVAVVASQVVPPRYSALVVAVGSLAQAGVALANHQSQPVK